MEGGGLRENRNRETHNNLKINITIAQKHLLTPANQPVKYSCRLLPQHALERKLKCIQDTQKGARTPL